MRISVLPVLALSIALLGASCSLKPLGSDTEESRGYADVKVGETTKQPEVTKPTPKPIEPEPTEETPEEEEVSKPETETPSETPATSGKVIGELKVQADAGSIVVFLTAEKADYKGTDAYMEFGCESLLVPVKRSLTKTQSDLAHAIVELITIKQQAYADQGLRNAVAPSAPTIKLTNIHYEGKTRVIDFEGSFLSAGTCDDPRIKAQIEETVKLYVSDYQIRLNGKESEWRCLFDQSGTCS